MFLVFIGAVIYIHHFSAPHSTPLTDSPSPPPLDPSLAIAFNVGPDGFTEDWGAFELDGPKFKDAFKGNFIDLGAFRFISLQVV